MPLTVRADHDIRGFPPAKVLLYRLHTLHPRHASATVAPRTSRERRIVTHSIKPFSLFKPKKGYVPVRENVGGVENVYFQQKNRKSAG